eukprot:6466451-Amphidinium_carterae.1
MSHRSSLLSQTSSCEVVLEPISHGTDVFLHRYCLANTDRLGSQIPPPSDRPLQNHISLSCHQNHTSSTDTAINSASAEDGAIKD